MVDPDNEDRHASSSCDEEVGDADEPQGPIDVSSPLPSSTPPPPANSDFVIREGFPALRKPGLSENRDWLIEGQEPLPRHEVWARDRSIMFSHLECWRRDCHKVFTAREREQDQPYSAGVTYFCPCQMHPRCALEALALSIFWRHCGDLECGVMIPEQSGAEWWTLVLENDGEAGGSDNPSSNAAEDGGDDDDDVEGDDVGLHFDADYGLEDQAPNLLLHPRLATVTYLTSAGAPTLVMDQRSPPPDDPDRKTLHNRSIRRAWLSHPAVGKHLAFDGRLLHGAPATFFPRSKRRGTSQTASSSNVGPPDCKRRRVEEEVPGMASSLNSADGNERITMLVNVWINHCPLDAELLDDDVCRSLETPFVADTAASSMPTTDKEATHNGCGVSDASGSTGQREDQQCFQWSPSVDLARPPTCKRVSLAASPEDPAGEEEFVLCHRLVTAKYGASMRDLHDAVDQGDYEDLIELEMDEGVVQLQVGDEVDDDDDGNNDEEDNNDNDYQKGEN